MLYYTKDRNKVQGKSWTSWSYYPVLPRVVALTTFVTQLSYLFPTRKHNSITLTESQAPRKGCLPSADITKSIKYGIYGKTKDLKATCQKQMLGITSLCGVSRQPDQCGLLHAAKNIGICAIGRIGCAKTRSSKGCEIAIKRPDLGRVDRGYLGKLMLQSG